MNLHLKEMRIARGYKKATQFSDALQAADLDYPVRQIRAWESGERKMYLSQACEIAHFLGCSLDELAGRDWSPPEYSDARQGEINDAYLSSDEEARTDILRAARNAHAASVGRAGGGEEAGGAPPGAVSA